MTEMRPATCLALSLWLALSAVATAQGLPPPAPPYYAMDPRTPLAPHADGPVQQQVLESYRSQLLQAQREMLSRNPGGAGPDQLEINRRLNAFGPGAVVGASPPAAPAPPDFNTIPQPPFNAAPHP